MTLDPDIAAALRAFKPDGAPPLSALPPQLVRDGMAAHAASAALPARPVGMVENRSIALRSGDQGPALRALLALYPGADLRLPSRHASVQENGGGEYGISADDMAWFTGHYLRGPEDALDPRASPLLSDGLGGLPPTLLVTAQYDPLRDEGRALARRLAEAGVAVRDWCFEGLPHGFASMTAAAPSARRALDEVSRALAALLRA